MKCAWSHGCKQQATHVHIMGCENMHITERPFCEGHTREWSRFINNKHALCHDCEDLILLTQIIPADQVTHLVNPVLY